MRFKKSNYFIEKIKNKLYSYEFMRAYRNSQKDFIRNRKLPFHSLVLFMLNLVKHTLQKELTNFINLISNIKSPLKGMTKSAFCQSRMKLKPEAFKALNDVIIEEFYTDNIINKWNGFRLLSFDGSTSQLPYSEELKKNFGFNKSETDKQLPLARISTCYDLLNDIILESNIGHYQTNEIQMAFEHTKLLNKDDLIILDRGYGSTWLFQHLISKGCNFVCRVQKNFIAEVDKFWETNEESKIIEINKCPKKTRQQLKSKGITFEGFKLRLVKVFLDNGETEVLATSLLNEEKYPTSIFKELYFKRWGIETNYDHMKNQLEVEDFTGKSVTAVMQDFYANIFILNLQSVIARDAQLDINSEKKNNTYKHKVNKNLSLGFMKDRIIKILTSGNPNYVEELKNLFKTESVPVRNSRRFSRKKRKKRKKYFQNKRNSV